MKKNKATNRNPKRSNGIILTIVMGLIMAMFTGCSSAKEPTDTEEVNFSAESTAETKIDEPANATEGEAVSSATASEDTVEATPEPAGTEAVVYEGIDMESTLPGLEWIATFEGVIDEPKIVVFNDVTNKKVIVENGGTVEFAADDTLAIYRAGAKIDLTDEDLLKFNNVNAATIMTVSGSPRKYSDSGDTFEFQPILELNGEDLVYKITVNVQ